MDQVQKIPFVGVEHGPDLSHLFEKRVFSDGENTLPYRIYVPKDLSPEKRYPLVLFFHGAGERGNDNERQLLTGPVSSSRIPHPLCTTVS